MAADLAFPWHAALGERLRGMNESGKMPHALLLSGPRFLGKRAFAVSAARYMLCKSPVSGEACGSCRDCRLVAAGTHPDLRFIEPEASKLILIEQIRGLIDWANQTAQREGYKVVIVQPAEQMNVNSANALLKGLEEPPKQTLFLLVSDVPGRLLPTIRSRCQQFAFPMPSRSEALAWLDARQPGMPHADLMLSIAGGIPLRAVQELDEEHLLRRQDIEQAMSTLLDGANPLEVAAGFARTDAALDLGVIQGIVMDALKKKFDAKEIHIKNKDMTALLNAICDRLSTRDLFSFHDLVVRERAAVAGQSNPNVQFLFEGLFVRLHHYGASQERL